jgi:hypothetical protein
MYPLIFKLESSIVAMLVGRAELGDHDDVASITSILYSCTCGRGKINA